MLSVDSVSASYGNLRVLWDVSMSAEAGEIVSIVGANGAGKSTIPRKPLPPTDSDDGHGDDIPF